MKTDEKKNGVSCSKIYFVSTPCGKQPYPDTAFIKKLYRATRFTDNITALSLPEPGSRIADAVFGRAYENSEDLEPEISEMVDRDFWDLV